VYRNEYKIIKKNEKWITELRITQIQENAEFFRMILPIRIKYDDGSYEDIKVMNSVDDEIFTFISENKPEQIIFDPNDNIILKSSTTNRID